MATAPDGMNSNIFIDITKQIRLISFKDQKKYLARIVTMTVTNPDVKPLAPLQRSVSQKQTVMSFSVSHPFFKADVRSCMHPLMIMSLLVLSKGE